jgi:hypothetical protein
MFWKAPEMRISAQKRIPEHQGPWVPRESPETKIPGRNPGSVESEAYRIWKAFFKKVIKIKYIWN